VLTVTDMQMLVIGAAAALAVSTTVPRFLWSRPRPSGVQGVPPPVPAAPHVPVLSASPPSGASATASESLSEAPETPVKLLTRPAPTGARMYVNAPEQVHEFLDHMTRNGFARGANCDDPEAGRATSEEWFESYCQWAARLGIAVLPDCLFLANLAKHPRIKRSRPRAKDPMTGRCLKNEQGKEVKVTAYTLFERAPVEAVMRDPVTGRAKKVLVAPDDVRVVQRQLKRAA